MPDHYSFPDFLDYCSEQSTSFRLADEVFWSTNKPIPTTLIRQLFFSISTMLEMYSDHLNSAVLLALSELLGNGKFRAAAFPDANLRAEGDSELRKIFQDISTRDDFSEFQNRLSRVSGLAGRTLAEDNFIKSLDHRGKKYDRIFYPEIIRSWLGDLFPKVQGVLGRQNGDFFGNEIADFMSVYRSGYSDLFSAIFNHYLSFKFEYFPNIDVYSANQGQIAPVLHRNIGQLVHSEYAGGNLWDPHLAQGGMINANVDLHHPLGSAPDDVRYELLILAMSFEEMRVFSDREKEIIELFRYRSSLRAREFFHAWSSSAE
jgi:hypothetical protein